MTEVQQELMCNLISTLGLATIYTNTSPVGKPSATHVNALKKFKADLEGGTYNMSQEKCALTLEFIDGLLVQLGNKI